METFVQEGDVLEFTAPSGGVTVGTGVKIGVLLVIPLVTAAEAAKFNGVVKGVITHAKTSAQAWTEGQQLCWDDTNKVFTTTTLANYIAGVAVKAADNPSATGYVRLNGVSLPAAGGA